MAYLCSCAAPVQPYSGWESTGFDLVGVGKKSASSVLMFSTGYNYGVGILRFAQFLLPFFFFAPAPLASPRQNDNNCFCCLRFTQLFFSFSPFFSLQLP